MSTLIIFPDQSVGEPETVNVKMSQFVPSTQVASPSGEPPPSAVPFHVTGELDGFNMPEEGADAFTKAKGAKRNVIKKSATNTLKKVDFLCVFIFVDDFAAIL